MTLLKPRKKSKQLTILEALNKRMDLPDADKHYLSNLSKGYKGEMYYDSLIEEYIKTTILILNDLEFVVNNTPIQIDSLLITSDAIYLYEIKYYEGDYINSLGHFTTLSGHTFVNPAEQLNRTTTLFTRLLKNWQYSFPVNAYVIFVNPAFTLYEAKVTDPFIFHSQIKNHVSSLNKKNDFLTHKHYYIADKLLEETQKDMPYQRTLPSYSFEELKKGLSCLKCGSFKLRNNEKTSVCLSCKHTFSLTDCVLAEINEFTLLFPKEKLSRNTIFEWCGGELSKRRIATILNNHFIRKGHAHSSYYI